jgi:hypothetical protein
MECSHHGARSPECRRHLVLDLASERGRRWPGLLERRMAASPSLE